MSQMKIPSRWKWKILVNHITFCLCSRDSASWEMNSASNIQETVKSGIDSLAYYLPNTIVRNFQYNIAFNPGDVDSTLISFYKRSLGKKT